MTSWWRDIVLIAWYDYQYIFSPVNTCLTDQLIILCLLTFQQLLYYCRFLKTMLFYLIKLESRNIILMVKHLSINISLLL